MEILLSEIKMFGFDFAPHGFHVCDGSTMPISQNQALFAIIGFQFGGDGARTFALPDLRNRVVIGSGNNYPPFSKGGEETHTLTLNEMPKHRHQAVASSNEADTIDPKDHFWPSNMGYTSTSNSAMDEATMEVIGKDLPHENMSPYIAMNFCIALQGIYPSPVILDMDEYIGAIKPFALDVKPGQWLPCDGSLVSAKQYNQLFAVIGYTFGGEGDRFALPDLRGRAATAFGTPPYLTHYKLGEKAGEAAVKLTVAQMPIHGHVPFANTRGTSQRPDGFVWANDELRNPPKCFTVGKGSGEKMHAEAIGERGGDEAHNNMMPYQTLEYRICANGVFPSGE